MNSQGRTISKPSQLHTMCHIILITHRTTHITLYPPTTITNPLTIFRFRLRWQRQTFSLQLPMIDKQRK